jgi:hypothetical protein
VKSTLTWGPTELTAVAVPEDPPPPEGCGAGWEPQPQTIQQGHSIQPWVPEETQPAGLDGPFTAVMKKAGFPSTSVHGTGCVMFSPLGPIKLVGSFRA